MTRSRPGTRPQNEIFPIVDRLYAAALGTECYSEVLAALGNMLGGCAIGMSLQQQPLRMWLSEEVFDPDRTALMGRDYSNVSTNPMIAIMAGLPVSTVTPRQSVISDKVYFGSGVYSDVFRPQGLVHAAVACGYRSGERFAPVGIFRTAKREEFGSDEFNILSAVLPHLARSLEIYLRIGTLVEQQRHVDFALDALSFGVVFIDHHENVRKANSLAEAIFRQNDGLTVRGGRIVAASAAENDILQAALRRSLGNGGSLLGMADLALSVSRPSLRRSYSVLVLPLPVSREDGGVKAGSVLILADPENGAQTSPEVLARLFGLTRAQALLLSRLAAGLSLSDAAEIAGISLQTAKSHLKAIFERTSTHRQSELVRLVMQSAAVVRPVREQ